MAGGQKKLTKNHIYFITGGAAVLLIGLMVLVVSFLMKDNGKGRQKQMQMVTLLAPPPPPKIEEQPPEPEEIEEKIDTPEDDQPIDEPEDTSDDLPPAEALGLDADAGLGGDAFGLEARKGGRGILEGNNESPFNWYATHISRELQKLANDIIQKEGGIPSGDWKIVNIEVMLDVFGNIKRFSLLSSSGNSKINNAVDRALQSIDQFEPPPPGMPKVLRIVVSLQG